MVVHTPFSHLPIQFGLKIVTKHLLVPWLVKLVHQTLVS